MHKLCGLLIIYKIIKMANIIYNIVFLKSVFVDLLFDVFMIFTYKNKWCEFCTEAF